MNTKNLNIVAEEILTMEKTENDFQKMLNFIESKKLTLEDMIYIDEYILNKEKT